MRSFLLIIVTLCCVPGSAFGARPDLRGRVVDTEGRALVYATVMVYHAGVTTGYSIFCPSCYADCGKRVVTGGKGEFLIKSLAPGLWFKLLAADPGYVPTLSERVNPCRLARGKVV